jgi:malonate transporter MadM subunit
MPMLLPLLLPSRLRMLIPMPLTGSIRSPPPNRHKENIMIEMLEKTVLHNGLVTAFAVVGLIMYVSMLLSRYLTFGRVHGSAIAILIGLALAYWGGIHSGGQKGLADLSLFSGIGLMGGAMLRDFAIVATAFEVQASEARKAGLIGVVALVLGTVLPFIVGASVAYAFGYTDAVSMTTIGAGAVTYIVGPVTGAAIGASSEIVALSIATGLLKAIMVMVGTPIAAKFLGLKTPRSAMVFGGLAGTVSGVSAGLAATDRKLVPYGTLVATFHTGLGCLLGPSLLFFATKSLVG